jgi:hypothetical protein
LGGYKNFQKNLQQICKNLKDWPKIKNKISIFGPNFPVLRWGGVNAKLPHPRIMYG